MAEPSTKLLTRRGFLKSAIAIAGGAALASALPRAAFADGAPGRAVTVFRLRTRHTRSCNACKSHHRYTFFISRPHADRNRAHPGCNCPITKQRLPQERFNKLFLQSGAIRNGAVDIRELN